MRKMKMMKTTIISGELAAYLTSFAPVLDDDLLNMQQAAYDEGLPIISNDVVSFLRVMLAVKKPMKVLEVGCCIGFSSLLMARYMERGGEVVTIDRYPMMISRAKQNFADMDRHGQIKLIEGDAADILPHLVDSGREFDMIFLDAGKGQYNRLFPFCIKLLAKNGVFLADDVLQGGTVAWDLEKIEKRQRTTHRNLNEFLQAAMGSAELTSVILPIGDGLLVCIKEQHG